MTVPKEEKLSEKLDKTAIERFESWLETYDAAREDMHVVVPNLLKGTTRRTKEKLVFNIKNSDKPDAVAYVIEALIAADIMNESIFARKALANEVKKMPA